MSLIELETIINAPIERCFNLSLSPKLHIISAGKTKETIIKGRSEGIFQLGDEITWRGRHFGISQEMTVKITELRFPEYFSDEMVKGNFKSMRHDHHFYNDNGKTIMKDFFQFESPLGILGKTFNNVFLKNYMSRFLIERNNVIKDYVETEKWKRIL